MKEDTESCLNCGNEECRFAGSAWNFKCGNYDKNEKVAYICDGNDDCSLEPNCFLRDDYVTATDSICHHTTHPKHAKNELCEDPENHPERFTFVPGGKKIKYYERLPWEEI